MNVGFSLAPFSYRTLSEQFVYLSTKFNCEKQFETLDDNGIHRQDIPAIYVHWIDILDPLVASGERIRFSERDEMKWAFAALKFCCVVGSHYFPRFLVCSKTPPRICFCSCYY